MVKLFIESFQCNKIYSSPYFAICFTQIHDPTGRSGAIDDYIPVGTIERYAIVLQRNWFVETSSKNDKLSFLPILILLISSEFIEILCDRHIESDHSVCTNWSIRHSIADKRQRKMCEAAVLLDAAKSTSIFTLCPVVTHSIRETIAKTTSDAAMGKKVCIRFDAHSWNIWDGVFSFLYPAVNWTSMRWNIASQSIRREAKILYAMHWLESSVLRLTAGFSAHNWKLPIVLFALVSNRILNSNIYDSKF